MIVQEKKVYGACLSHQSHEVEDLQETLPSFDGNPFCTFVVHKTPYLELFIESQMPLTGQAIVNAYNSYYEQQQLEHVRSIVISLRRFNLPLVIIKT